MLWNKYWASTLAQSPIVVNRSYTVGQLDDLAEKLRRSEGSVARRGVASAGATFGGGASGASGPGENTQGGETETKEEKVERIMAEMSAREAETPLAKAVSDSTKVSMEAHNGLISQVLKDALFNRSATGALLPPPL